MQFQAKILKQMKLKYNQKYLKIQKIIIIVQKLMKHNYQKKKIKIKKQKKIKKKKKIKMKKKKLIMII